VLTQTNIKIPNDICLHSLIKEFNNSDPTYAPSTIHQSL